MYFRLAGRLIKSTQLISQYSCLFQRYPNRLRNRNSYLERKYIFRGFGMICNYIKGESDVNRVR